MDRSGSRLPLLGSKKPDRTGLSNTSETTQEDSANIPDDEVANLPEGMDIEDLLEATEDETPKADNLLLVDGKKITRHLLLLVFKSLVHRTEKRLWTQLNRTDGNRTFGCGCPLFGYHAVASLPSSNILIDHSKTDRN
jgi:hypothetical protein